MDIMNRIKLLHESGFSTREDYEDLCKIVSIFNEEYNIWLTEENSGIMITHIAAAFSRNKTGEEISPLGIDSWAEIEGLPQFKLADEIIYKIESEITNEISENERKFFFLHICTLLVAYADGS